jgi:chromosome segregation ATPase
MSIDEMVSLRAYARNLVSEYDTQMVETPDWIEVQLKNLDRQIAAKNADRLEARRREIKSRLENLKTTVEKRAELKKELAQLDKQLEVA